MTHRGRTARTQLDPFYLESLRSGLFIMERIRFNGVERVQIAFREGIKRMAMVNAQKTNR